MAIAEDIYTRCRFCLEEAAGLLNGIPDGRRIDTVTVQARRCAADIAEASFYAVLRQTFITPIDREDLWLIYTAAERVLREAENAALRFSRQSGEFALADKTAIRSAAACCAQAERITASFPSLKISAQNKRILREAEHDCRTTDATYRLDRVIEACEHLITVLQYAALKNT